MVTAPSFILPFKTQLALFTAAISISRLTARTQISHIAAMPLAVSSCQAMQGWGQRHLHICTFRWLWVVLIEWDVPVVVFAVDISLRESVISKSVAVHQRRVFKEYKLSVLMIITILHVMHPQKMNIKYQCNTFTNVNTAVGASRAVQQQRWRLTQAVICPLQRNPGQVPTYPAVTYIIHLHAPDWLGDFMLRQWNNRVLFIFFFFF